MGVNSNLKPEAQAWGEPLIKEIAKSVQVQPGTKRDISIWGQEKVKAGQV